MIIKYSGIDKLEVKHWIRLTVGYLMVFPFFYTPKGGDWITTLIVAVLLTLAANAIVTVPLLIEGIRSFRKKESLSVMFWKRAFLINFFLYFFVTLGKYI